MADVKETAKVEKKSKKPKKEKKEKRKSRRVEVPVKIAEAEPAKTTASPDQEASSSSSAPTETEKPRKSSRAASVSVVEPKKEEETAKEESKTGDLYCFSDQKDEWELKAEGATIKIVFSSTSPEVFLWVGSASSSKAAVKQRICEAAGFQKGKIMEYFFFLLVETV